MSMEGNGRRGGERARWLAPASMGVGLALVLAAGAAHLAAPPASAGVVASGGSSVQVTASGQASGTPDTLTLQLGVSTTASSATAALARNDSEMSRLQATLEGAGVASRGLSTADLQLSPNYDQSGTITGYTAEDELVVTLSNLHHAGTTIDAAADAVGDDVQIEGLSFSLADTEGLRQSARVAAMRAAHRAAAALAVAGGARLGRIEKITDDEQLAPPPPSPLPEFAAGASHAASVPVQPGIEQVTDQVTVVYELDD